MNNRVFLLFTLGSTLMASTASAQGDNKTNIAESALSAVTGNVNVRRCVKVLIAKDSPAYSIAYDYEFPGRSTVRLQGLGEVAAKGSFHYLSVDRELQFKDPATGAVLTTVPLRETLIVAAKPPLNELPGENEFPSAFRSYVWDSRSLLQERADAVLGEHFHYLPRENKGVTFLITTFAPLPLRGVPDGVIARVALLVSFPYDPTHRKYSVRIQSLVREGRALSDDFRSTSNLAIVQSADAFIDRLIAEMKSGENIKR